MATAERGLQRSEWRTLAILGVPTFALALGITTVSTYLPVLAEDFSDSSIVIGLLIGGQGLMALWLPLVVGSWSDRLRTPIGARLPFIIAATPPLVVALALLGFVSSVALLVGGLLISIADPLSRGLGISLGPLLGGVAIQAAGQDYRWVWLVCAAAILLSILAMYPLRDDEA